jgi:hypothetical protein
VWGAVSNGARQDDRSAVVEVREGFLHGEVSTLEVDVHDLVVDLFARLHERGELCDPALMNNTSMLP